ncbi:MAG: hypothetical protein V5A87_05235 [Candidatus Bipolaricaulota bacterium]|nr:hypothetical protein [Candidatus Bipolaricaulota bacterium]MBS3792505.1 hypothetical protein [Candidatus Bipolaricaulota bacterium]
MQTTIYYRETDQYLIKKLEEMAHRERKSKSACLLSILEEYFEARNRVGEILSDLGAISSGNLRKALEKQKEEGDGKKIGEIMLEEKYIKEIDLDRALEIQKS